MSARRICSLIAAAASLALPLKSQTLDDFFDTNVLHEVHLQMAPADWNYLKTNYLDSSNYACTFAWRDMVVTNATLRSRGSGSRNGIKPGLGIDFNKIDKNGRFLGMKGIVLRNSSQDATMIHERIAMGMFQKLGLPYEREAHVKLYINDEYSGLFLMVEAIETRFLTSWFGESDGYLYEMRVVSPPYRFDYLGDNPGLYVPQLFEPKNHEDAPDADRIASMIQTMNQATDADFVAALDPYLDLNDFVTHLAAEQFMAEWDGIVADAGVTNLYLYRRQSDNRFVFLVWDKEQTMTNTVWPIWRNMDTNVLSRRLLAIPRFRERFLDTLHQATHIAGGPGGWMQTETERLLAQTREAALEDPVRVCVVNEVIDHCPESVYEAEVQNTRAFVRDRTAFVEGELRAAGYYEPHKVMLSADVSNAASGGTHLSPGALAHVAVSLDTPGVTQASGTPLPLSLAGVRIRVGGVDAPILEVSPDGALIQVPWETLCGPATVEVVVNGIRVSEVMAQVRPSDPGVFAVVVQGDVLIAYVTGLGVAKEKLETGSAAPSDAIIPVKAAVSATIDGSPATVLWAGMAPGYVGLQQVNLRIPQELASGQKVKLLLFTDQEAGDPYVFVLR